MMRIGGTNYTYLGLQKKLTPDTKVENKNASTPEQITSLTDIKQPIDVNIPINYKKLGIEKLSNGQEIHNYKLANGLRVSILPMETNNTIIRTFVNTGAINEKDSQRGISHFLEHMAFNGTSGNKGYKKLSTGDVFKIVGKIGGSTNACTNFALTDYYIQAPIFYDSDLEEIIKIQGAMMNNLSLPESMIEKERGPVISEINMYTDIPETLAYNTAIKNLYNLETTSTDYIAGTTTNINNLTRADVLDYYKQNYHPANMFTTLAGDVEPDEAIKLIAKNFHSKVENPPIQTVNKLTPITSPIRRDFVSPKTLETLGCVVFNGPENNNLKDSIIIDIIGNLFLGNANSRIKKHILDTSINFDLISEKISTNPNDGSVICFEFSANEEEHQKALEILYSELENFKTPSEKNVDIIKKSLLIKLDKMYKRPEAIVGLIGNMHFKTGDNSVLKMEETIKSITAEDITNCVKKYLNLNKASIAVVHPAKKNSNNISFTGKKKRQILKPDKINTYKLSNNIDVATYKTKGDYRNLTIEFVAEKTPEQKPGEMILLYEIMQNGTKNYTRSELDGILAMNHIENSVDVDANSMTFTTACDKDDIEKALEIICEQLYSPNITEEALEKAKKNIRQRIENTDYYATGLIYDAAYPNSVSSPNRKDVLANLDNITLQDIEKLRTNILKNATGQAAFTVNEDDTEYSEKILNIINSMPNVNPKTFESNATFNPTKDIKVHTYENQKAQADVALGYKYYTNGNIKDGIAFNLLKDLISKISFEDLREKQQLAYSVYAYNESDDDKNFILGCNILTTTQDEFSGKTSYENIQKSIDGFNKIIANIIQGNFSEEDLEAVKLEYKASYLHIADSDKMCTHLLSSAQRNPYGILSHNQRYNLIDTITKEDIVAAAKYIFKNKPIYAVTATKEALNENKNYFTSLTQN